MGGRIFLVIILSMIMIIIIDLFPRWYSMFLNKMRIEAGMQRLFVRLAYVLLTFIFWESLVARQDFREITVSHFLFALFIFCLYKLIRSFQKQSGL